MRVAPMPVAIGSLIILNVPSEIPSNTGRVHPFRHRCVVPHRQAHRVLNGYGMRGKLCALEQNRTNVVLPHGAQGSLEDFRFELGRTVSAGVHHDR